MGTRIPIMYPFSIANYRTKYDCEKSMKPGHFKNKAKNGHQGIINTWSALLMEFLNNGNFFNTCSIC